MSDKLVQFEIPASFIDSRARLTPRELHWGYQDGWIANADVVQLAMSNVVPETEPMAAVESLSLLLSDELDRVPDLVGGLLVDEKAVWVYLTLAWIIEHPAEFDDNPFQTVEKLYADFDYPSQMEPFVPFMPPPVGATPGVAGLEERLRLFLTESWDHYFTSRGPSDKL